MNHAISGRSCYDCGRPLEPGETCNCRQRPRGETRDGLRAHCPRFRHRSSYRGDYYIVCGAHAQKSRFRVCDQRNDYYREYCCERFAECELYLPTMKGERENNA